MLAVVFRLSHAHFDPKIQQSTVGNFLLLRIAKWLQNLIYYSDVVKGLLAMIHHLFFVKYEQLLINRAKTVTKAHEAG